MKTNAANVAIEYTVGVNHRARSNAGLFVTETS